MTSLIWLADPAPLDRVAILAFSGWGDAGSASTLALRHLRRAARAGHAGLIEPDDFFDFSRRRPDVVTTRDGGRALEWPQTAIHTSTTPALAFVLGEEPHLQWRRFAATVQDAMQRLRVSTVITLGSFLAEVTHTRDVPLVGVTYPPGLAGALGLSTSAYEGPTGIVGVINDTLAGAGIDVISVWAAIPPYLGDQEYEPAALAIARQVGHMIDWAPDFADLERMSVELLTSIDLAVEDDPDLADMVRALERGLPGDVKLDGPGLIAEIEQFLRGR